MAQKLRDNLDGDGDGDLDLATANGNSDNVSALLNEIAGCDYATGEVNGSGSYNGLDVTYGVNFFKGGNDPMCEECPLYPGWWYCGDVNASCSYNGLYVNYGVNYFKGGAGPVPCGDCPPAGGAVIAAGKMNSISAIPGIQRDWDKSTAPKEIDSGTDRGVKRK